MARSSFLRRFAHGWGPIASRHAEPDGAVMSVDLKYRWPLVWGILCAIAGSMLSALPAQNGPSAATPHFDRAGDSLPDHALARFGTIRFRQSSAITQVEYSPDGN